MKKHLGVAKMLEKDVPQHLDAVILAHAALTVRRRSQRKIFRIATAAATLLISLSALGIFLFRTERSDAVRQTAEYTSAELLAMTDFTILEQENYAVGSMTSAGENMFDTYI